jgi:hypothetical protein
LHAHLAEWPRDALVLASASNPNGVIGASSDIRQKHQIAVLMDTLAPHYGDDCFIGTPCATPANASLHVDENLPAAPCVVPISVP